MSNLAFTLVTIVAFLVTLSMGVYIILSASRTILRRHLTGEHKTTRSHRISSGTPVEARIFGFEIKGGRIFGAFGLGVAMLLVPLKFSLEGLTPSQVPAQSVVPEPDPEEVIDSTWVGEPDYDGVHFIKDIRVIDLRSRVPIPPDRRRERVSPVTWTRYSLIEKSAAAPDTVDFEFGTTGVGLTPRSLTHEHSLIRASTPHVHGSDTLRYTWRIRADISEEPVDQPFLIVTEVTYWNGFDDERKEWAAMRAEEGTDEVGMILLFPDQKPMQSWQLQTCPPGPQCKTFTGEHVLIPSANKKVLVWKVPHPKVGYTYRIHWTW